jgi:hypothetical protein
MSLEMAHKVILPPKKNYISQFLKQRDINSYYSPELPLRVATGLDKSLIRSANGLGFLPLQKLFV